MNAVRMPTTKHLLNCLRSINNVKTIQRCASVACKYSTFTVDAFAKELIEKRRLNDPPISESSIQYFTDSNNRPDVSRMSQDDLDTILSELLSKNRDKDVEEFIIQCQNIRKYISWIMLKKLFKHYSSNGKTEMVVILQNYCAKVDPVLYKRNGEYLHFLAKAQCMKGNSEKGLSLLTICYKRYEHLRSFYRLIFRDLIQDSVLNRSEASLVVFKKSVLEFSSGFSDHYPLVCYWHICWASTWFSDQMLANELLETSNVLLDIIGDKASALSTMALRDYNEDAVVRLLQTFLKHDMMSEYVTVLQVLFNYKLRNRDIRGCSEIIRNCEVLGVSLPSDQQGKYIKMLIEGKTDTRQPNKTLTKDFKLKF